MNRNRFLRTTLSLFCLTMLLSCCGNYRERDGRMFYTYWPNEAERIEREVTGYDSRSFKVLKGYSFDGKVYAKDKEHVWYRGLPVEGADPATFRPRSAEWSVDARHIFYQNAVRSAAHPTTLRVLDQEYALDADSVYRYGKSIPQADPSSFALLRHSYARDRHRVYLGGRVLEDPDDAAAYKVIDFLWGRDQKAYYFLGKRIPQADYASFQIVYDGNSAGCSYARDKNRVWYCNNFGGRIEIAPVEGADPATFHLTGRSKSVGEDKHGYYYLGRRAECSEVEYDL